MLGSVFSNSEPRPQGLRELRDYLSTVPNGNVQTGAKYVSSLINPLMSSGSWKDSVFVLSWDESGGFFDHVPPQPITSPDGGLPKDLQSGDICWQSGGPMSNPLCTFSYTGYRVPLIVVSPFTRKNYVSHEVMDYTSIIKFVETRFGITDYLTERDRNAPDMTDFFDFAGIPWAIPPTPPTQSTSARCYLDHLP